MLDPYKIRKDFPMYQNHIKMQGKDLVFLDNASTTFKPYPVLKAIEDYYSFYTSNHHRGDYDLCYNVDVKIKETRQLVAKFINADVNECVFTTGTTQSINIIAYGYALKNLSKDDEILISIEEHASNSLPWFEVAKTIGCKIKYIELNKEGRITPENVKKAISKRTKIVAIAQVSNVLGYLVDIKEIARIAHENGAILACDGAQSVPHRKTDVKDLDVDFLSFSAHKMCGPTGVGVLYIRKELFDKVSPVFVGGGNNVTFKPEHEVTYYSTPAKLEAGTLNIEGIIGFKAALEYLMKIGMENIEQYEQNLRKYAINRIKEVKDLIIYNEGAEEGIITLNMKGIFAQDLGTYLNSKGIAVRTGQHCAKMLPLFLNTPATVRVSLYFYNTKEDIDIFIENLKNGGNFLDAYFA